MHASGSWASSHNKRVRLVHGAKIGAKIDDVGDEQKKHDHSHQPPRIMLPDIAGDPLAGDPTDLALTSWIATISR
jgi:hypothetical protein